MRRLILVGLTLVLLGGPGCIPKAVQILSSDLQQGLETGMAQYKRGDYTAATATLERLYKTEPNASEICYWLGLSYYQLGQYKQAREKLERTIRLDRTMAKAYNALGLVFNEMKYRTLDAMKAFRKAARLDSAYAEPHYNLGLTSLKMGKVDIAEPFYVMKARKAFLRTIEIDPNHPQAYFALGHTYEKYEKDYRRAIPFYLKQLEVNPNHEEAARHLGKSLFRTGNYAQGIELLNERAAGNPNNATLQRMLLQLRIGLYHEQGNYAGLAKTYDAYIQSLNPEERALYRTLELVASPEERKAYNALQGAAKERYWNRFWTQRDPLLATALNERLIEHYRRILYAREHFSEGKFPWDQRGNFYVRYGQPDDRQRFILGSDEVANESLYRLTGNARVDAIRQANFDLRRFLLTTGIGATNLEDQFAPAPNRVGLRAESWVYVEHDIELFFVDYGNHDVYDFPFLNFQLDVRELQRQAQYHPKVLSKALVEKKPEDYHYDFGGDPLEFLFDMVAFRGEDQQTRLEVYFNVPLSELGWQGDGKGAQTWLNSVVVLLDEGWNRRAESQQRIGPLNRPEEEVTEKQVDVDLTTYQMNLMLPPGTFHSSIEVRDAATRKIGIYRKDVLIEDYWTDGLHLSDIKLAHEIRPSQEDGPFTRDGLLVIPNPARIFAHNQLIFLYYEIYNLTPDSEGQTRYRSDIRITFEEKKPNIVWRILAMGTLSNRQEDSQSLTLSYDNRGFQKNEVQYTRIDLGDSPVGTYMIELTVHDLNSAIQVTKTVRFKVTGP